MHAKQRTKLAWLGGGAALIALVFYGVAKGGGDDGETVKVTRGLIHRVIVGKGTIEPRSEVRLTANMIGRIDAILVDEGDDVKPGQVVVRMDDVELRARLAQAVAHLDEARARYAETEAGARPQELGSMRAREREAEAVLTDATATLERSQALLSSGLISRAQMDEAKGRHAVAAAQYQSAGEQLRLLEAGARPEIRQAMLAQVRKAEADVRLARASLDQTVIRSPIAGRVVRRSMEPGEVIVLQRPEPILILADTSHTRVRTEIDETDARALKVGQAAEMTSDAFPGQVFKGTVIEIGAMVGRKSLLSDDPAERVDTKVVEAVVELKGTHKLTWGISAEVAIVVEHRENVPVVPRSAVRTEGGVPKVMVREGPKTSERAIRVGAGDDDYVEVLEGLNEGDVVFRQ